MRVSNFDTAIEIIERRFLNDSYDVHPSTWQGVDASRSDMAMREIRHVFLDVSLKGLSLNAYRNEIKPNLPWADDHFEERVCGQPLNPGVQWAKWPYGHSADKFRDAEGKFNHNYMERYWPKYAGNDPDEYGNYSTKGALPNHGIRGEYGDLRDVVDLLYREPLTRQAILPVWFPEDTGAVNGGRVPCSLFYQFLVRNNRMDITYSIRSCDMIRHMRDDMYLTVRLLIWMIEELRKSTNPFWLKIEPGRFVMSIGSLHMFVNDWHQFIREVHP